MAKKIEKEMITVRLADSIEIDGFSFADMSTIVFSNLECDNIRFAIEEGGGLGDYYESDRYHVIGDRLETDEEFKVRLGKIALEKSDRRAAKLYAKESKERADREEYERLKAKFG